MKSIFTFLAIVVLAFASFAVPAAESPPQADMVNVTSSDGLTSPNIVVSIDIEQAVYSAAEVDIGDQGTVAVTAKPSAVTQRQVAMINRTTGYEHIEYAHVDAGPSLTGLAKFDLCSRHGFRGFGANHNARADV